MSIAQFVTIIDVDVELDFIYNLRCLLSDDVVTNHVVFPANFHNLSLSCAVYISFSTNNPVMSWI